MVPVRTRDNFPGSTGETLSPEVLAPFLSQALKMSAQDVLQAFAPARPQDLAAVLGFRRQVIGDQLWWDDEAFVRWRYFDRRAETRLPYWVFKRNGEIIGACGIEPVTLVIDRRPHEAVRTLDIMVRPDSQGLGLGAFLNTVLFRHFPIITVTGSNPRSHKLISRMFRHVVDLQPRKAVIRSRRIFERRLKVPLLAGAAGAAGDLAFALERRLRRVSRPQHLDIRPIESFDDRVTMLSAAAERDGRLLVRRSADYLNWRFIHNPRCRYRVFGAFDNERLAGYVVCRFNQQRPNPAREAEIVDWLAPLTRVADEWPLPYLMQFAFDTLAAEGAGVVTCSGHCEEVDSALASTGFRLRPDERLPFFVRAADPRLHHRLCSPQDWFLTHGDFDVE